jgi:hypothetical protein
MSFAITPVVTPDTMLGHQKTKAQPGWAKMWISLDAGYRRTGWTIEQCFIKEKCAQMPTFHPRSALALRGKVIPTFSPWRVVGFAALADDPVWLWGLRLGSLQ